MDACRQDAVRPGGVSEELKLYVIWYNLYRPHTRSGKDADRDLRAARSGQRTATVRAARPLSARQSVHRAAGSCQRRTGNDTSSRNRLPRRQKNTCPSSASKWPDDRQSSDVIAQRHSALRRTLASGFGEKWYLWVAVCLFPSVLLSKTASIAAISSAIHQLPSKSCAS